MSTGSAGRVAWVTGAAGALGEAIAHALVADGATVVLSGRTPASLIALQHALRAAAVADVMVEAVDLTSRQRVDETAMRIEQVCGRIDFLVNCTALPIFGDFMALEDDDWDQVLDAKLLGYVRTIRAVLPVMLRQGFGRIVNVSGRGGRQPTAAHLPGGCANAAVNLLTKGLADAYGPRGIRINAVAPGPIETPRFAQIAASNEALNKSSGAAASKVPLARLGRPADVARAVLFLLSERSDYTTGAVLPVDGGGTATV